jgi:hypothetical protein
MELCITLTLRVYGTIPDPVVLGIIRFRRQLYYLYRRAYIEYASGLGIRARVKARGRAEFEMSGIYLDLRIRFASGHAPAPKSQSSAIEPEPGAICQVNPTTGCGT